MLSLYSSSNHLCFDHHRGRKVLSDVKVAIKKITQDELTQEGADKEVCRCVLAVLL